MRFTGENEQTNPNGFGSGRGEVGNRMERQNTFCPVCGNIADHVLSNRSFYCQRCRRYILPGFMSNGRYPPQNGSLSSYLSDLGDLGIRLLVPFLILMAVGLIIAVLSPPLMYPRLFLPSISTPHGDMTIDGNTTGNFTVTVQAFDSCGLNLSEAEYFLVTPEGTDAASGLVVDINGTNMEEPGVDISFTDADENGKISVLDKFILKGMDNEGICGSGYRFTIKFVLTDEVVMSERTP